MSYNEVLIPSLLQLVLFKRPFASVAKKQVVGVEKTCS